MTFPIAQLIELAKAGALILVNAKYYSVEELIKLVSQFNPMNGELTLLQATVHSPEDLLRIVEACPGKVLLGMN